MDSAVGETMYSSFYFVWRRKVLPATLLGLALPAACSSPDDPTPRIEGTGGAIDGSGGSHVSDAGSPAMGGDGSTAAPEEPMGLPTLLSEAGLFESDMETLASGVRPYRPRFELWTDGAVKRRWVWLPEGERIDTTDLDYWQYPVGTRLYKEFSRDGKRVETRVIQKRPNGGWWMVAYHWRDDQTDADAVPDGVIDASGTPHDIPSEEDCKTCHLRMPDKSLGFTAIQLAHETPPGDPEEWSLARLVEEDRLTTTPPDLPIPGDPTTRAVLGYLHGNCGHCHNPRSSVSSRVDLNLWLSTSALESDESTSTYLSIVGREIDLEEDAPEGASLRIDPGSPETSALFLRFDSRGESYSMPPLGTEKVDPEARAQLHAWITSLN